MKLAEYRILECDSTPKDSCHSPVSQESNKALQPTPLGVGAGFAGYAPCGAAELGR